MTSIIVNKNEVIIKPTGLYKFLAFRRRVVIPIENIQSVAPNSKPLMPYSVAAFGIGTIYANKIQSGTFKENRELSFWNVKNPKDALCLVLKNHRYSYVVVEVADRAKVIKTIQAAR